MDCHKKKRSMFVGGDHSKKSLVSALSCRNSFAKNKGLFQKAFLKNDSEELRTPLLLFGERLSFCVGFSSGAAAIIQKVVPKSICEGSFQRIAAHIHWQHT
jgi:hypothetical protein